LDLLEDWVWATLVSCVRCHVSSWTEIHTENTVDYFLQFVFKNLSYIE
jgi:hypothetical protein